METLPDCISHEQRYFLNEDTWASQSPAASWATRQCRWTFEALSDSPACCRPSARCFRAAMSSLLVGLSWTNLMHSGLRPKAERLLSCGASCCWSPEQVPRSSTARRSISAGERHSSLHASWMQDSAAELQYSLARDLRTKTGVRVVSARGSWVMGSVRLCRRWVVMASRSYTCPTQFMTGSLYSSCVMGHTRSAGVSNSHRREGLMLAGASEGLPLSSGHLYVGVADLSTVSVGTGARQELVLEGKLFLVSSICH
mmetsp:Transcript_14688/g.41326  ORF Transcript_14688/g.41326 Transcript_14688/m.41326 type:complete len:256 (-) Transcript_14688:200-967(-)